MACSLSLGYALPCKDKVGGIYKVFFANYDDALAGVTYNFLTQEVTAISATLDVYQYEVKGNNSLETTINSSRENGTLFFEQALSLTLTDLTAADLQIFTLASGRFVAFVQDNNGLTWAIGQEHGLELTAGTAVTGTAMGDLYGYTLTMTGQEKALPCSVPASTISDPFGTFTPIINS